jgi:hypothetical protein
MEEINNNANKLQKRYWILNSIPKSIRRIITVILLLLGFAIQIKESIFLGCVFILAASFLNLIRGIHIKKPIIEDTEWEKATFVEFNKILEKVEKIKKWSGFSIQGKIVMLIIYAFFVCPVLFSVFSIAKNEMLFIFFLDLNILFIPLFLSGNRIIWVPPNIKLKVETLLECAQHNYLKGNNNIKLQPYLLIGKQRDKSNIPLDAKLMIEFNKAPKEFLGIQIQVSVNNVGDKSYPYVYAVIIAGKELGLNMKNRRSGNIVYEAEKQDEMDILVIRQFTTKTSGYHTNEYVVNEIINKAYLEAGELLKEKGIEM